MMNLNHRRSYATPKSRRHPPIVSLPFRVPTLPFRVPTPRTVKDEAKSKIKEQASTELKYNDFGFLFKEAASEKSLKQQASTTVVVAATPVAPPRKSDDNANDIIGKQVEIIAGVNKRYKFGVIQQWKNENTLQIRVNSTCLATTVVNVRNTSIRTHDASIPASSPPSPQVALTQIPRPPPTASDDAPLALDESSSEDSLSNAKNTPTNYTPMSNSSDIIDALTHRWARRLGVVIHPHGVNGNDGKHKASITGSPPSSLAQVPVLDYYFQVPVTPTKLPRLVASSNNNLTTTRSTHSKQQSPTPPANDDDASLGSGDSVQDRLMTSRLVAADDCTSEGSRTQIATTATADASDEELLEKRRCSKVDIEILDKSAQDRSHGYVELEVGVSDSRFTTLSDTDFSFDETSSDENRAQQLHILNDSTQKTSPVVDPIAKTVPTRPPTVAEPVFIPVEKDTMPGPTLPAPKVATASIQRSPIVPQSPMETYEFSDADGESESDSDAESLRKPKKVVPTWAMKENLLPALELQYIGEVKIDPDEIFGEVQACDLEAIFDNKKSRYQRRTSSGNWTQDRATAVEKLTYKRVMGYEGYASEA